MQTTHTLKVAIFGAGSIGCYVGGRLVHAGCHVTFVGRDRFRRNIVEQGLTLTALDHEPIHIPSRNVDFQLRSKAISDADIVIITVKSQDSQTAAKDIAQHIKKEALIISLQNGMRNVDDIAAHLATQTILGGVVPYNVTSTGPGRFHRGTDGQLTVQEIDDPRLRDLTDAFQLIRHDMRLVSNIRAYQWGKLIVNLNNALNMLWGGTLKSGLMQRDYRRVLAAQMQEARDIILNAGEEIERFGPAPLNTTLKILRLPNWAYKIIMDKLIKIDPTARSSMLDDLEMGRPSEIDYLQGEIITLAKSTAQNAPITKSLYRLASQAFDAGSSPKLSGSDMIQILKQDGNTV